MVFECGANKQRDVFVSEKPLSVTESYLAMA